MKLCECGCGEQIVAGHYWKDGARRTRRFSPGHHVRAAVAAGSPPKKPYIPTPDEMPSGICECGCGETTPIYRGQTVRKERLFRGYRTPRLAWHGERKRGALHHLWCGGRMLNGDGYVLVYAPDHPDTGSKGYIAEHRLVMEQMIGRRLRRDENVHHKNHDKQDNRPENLELMSKSEHCRHHAIEMGFGTLIRP